jgi:hypothetical protein
LNTDQRRSYRMNALRKALFDRQVLLDTVVTALVNHELEAEGIKHSMPLRVTLMRVHDELFFSSLELRKAFYDGDQWTGLYPVSLGYLNKLADRMRKKKFHIYATFYTGLLRTDCYKGSNLLIIRAAMEGIWTGEDLYPPVPRHMHVDSQFTEYIR